MPEEKEIPFPFFSLNTPKKPVLVKLNGLFSVQHRIGGDVGHKKDDFADKQCPLCQEDKLLGRWPHQATSLR